MATPTYTPLATITLSSSASSVTFSNISQSYRDLVLVSVYTAASAFILAEFNNDSGSNYPFVEMYGTGSANASGTGTNTGAYVAYASTGVQNAYTQIMDYSATDKHKTVLSRHGNGNGFVTAEASRWANTAAITSIKLKPQSGTFDIGTTFSLYGIAA